MAGMVLLALYGCAQLFLKAALRLLRPKRPLVHLAVSLHGHVEDAEQQLRFARGIAKEQRLLLTVIDSDADDETRYIATQLLKNSDTLVVNAENLRDNACAGDAKRV